MKDIRAAPILPRGRVAKWSKEETEIAALCKELLDARPRGHAPVRRHKQAGEPRRVVTRGKAFEMNGVSLGNRVWSCGGVRTDGAVLLSMRAEDVQKAEGANSCLLWAPNIADSRPWSDSPGGKERLEHCRIALERGAAEGLLIYGKRAAGAPPEDKLPRADRVDAETVLNLRVEKRGDEYWASWTPAEKRVVVNSFE